jgi:hypothetical protein
MHYKEFKQRIRRQLGMKKHRILREHGASILERNAFPGNRRTEKTQAKRDTGETEASAHDTGRVQQNNHLHQKVLYTFVFFLFVYMYTKWD